MMGGVSPETCWAIKKQWSNKFYYTAASCWFFLWDFPLNFLIDLTPDLTLDLTPDLTLDLTPDLTLDLTPDLTFKNRAFYI